MSLRKTAKAMGISPTYLSLLVNGKRPWRQDLYDRYVKAGGRVVNTSKLSVYKGGAGGERPPPQGGEVVGGNGFEPMTSAMSTQRSRPLS